VKQQLRFQRHAPLQLRTVPLLELLSAPILSPLSPFAVCACACAAALSVSFAAAVGQALHMALDMAWDVAWDVLSCKALDEGLDEE
jgi:hypothetical protein